jgi:hypothetical protein
MKTLTDIIYQYENEEFNWKNFDCCTFSAKVVSEFTGKDITNFKEVENFKDLKGSIRWLKKMGCKDLSEAPSAFLGVKRKEISEVQLGDFVYYINEDNVGIIGVCNGKRAYFLQESGGLTARNISDCLYCWSIK